MTSHRTRDSQKVIHFLRSKLEKSQNISTSFQKGQSTNIVVESPSTSVSINASSHFSTYSIKNKCDKFEQYLLDVENLDKVYGVVRENLGVPRPKISVPRNERNLEFELKVTNDPIFREKILAKQRQSNTKADKKKRRHQSDGFNPIINENVELQEDSSVLDYSFNGFKEADTSKNATDNLDSATLEVINARKRLGQYNLDVKRYTGRKMSYQVYAYIERPKDKDNGQIEDSNLEESDINFTEDDLFMNQKDETEEKSPFVKVIISENNPFKRKQVFTPLKDEQINIEERMKKKWNPPDWMSFTGLSMRNSFIKPSVALSEVIGDCEIKLKSTKANNSFNDYNDKNFIKNLQNLSNTSKRKNMSLEREYNISLKHSNLVTPQIKLPTLSEKVEERNRIFGKSKENENSKPKDIKSGIQQNIENYEKMESRGNRSHRSSEKYSSFGRIPNRILKKQGKRDLSGGKRDSEKYPKQTEADVFNTTIFRPISRDQNKRNSGANPHSRQDTEKDEKAPMIFITQNLSTGHNQHDEDKLKNLETHHIEEANKNVEYSSPQASDTREFLSFKHAMVQEESPEERERRTMKMNNNIHGNRFQAYARGSLMSQGVTESNLEDENSPDDSEFRSTYNSKFNVLNKLFQRDNRRKAITPISGRRAVKAPPIPCDEIENRLNKTFTNFMNVKVKADNTFQTVLDVLKNDRPITNKIRYTKYRLDKMMFSHIDKFRNEAESCRVERYKKNSAQEKLYFEVLEYILSQELNETRLKACYFFMNVFKELLERGDDFSKEGFNEVLNKIDHEKLYTSVFLGAIIKVMEKLRVKPEEVENKILQVHLQKFIRITSIKKESQANASK